MPSLARPCFALVALFVFGLGSVHAAADCAPVSFKVAPNFGTEKNPTSVATGDFNEDGNTDLAVTNYGANSFSIFDGDGAGAFLPPRSFTVGVVHPTLGSSPRDVAVGDFNADGNLDLVVVGGYTTGWVAVVSGDGAGNFAPGVNVPIGTNASATAVALGDFNGDGKLDIAVVGGNSAGVSFLLGDGAGAFASARNAVVASEPNAVTTADFNNDGLTDVAVAGSRSGPHASIILGSREGSFTMHHSFTVQWSPFSIAAADFNGDGNADLAVTYSWSSPMHGVDIRLGDGTGNFGAPLEIFTGYEPASVVAADFDADGKADLAVSVSGANNIAILRGDGTGKFLSPKYYGTAVGPSQLAAADLNNDGKVDLASTHFDADRLTVLLGDGAGAFASTSTVLRGGAQIASADFNGDGLPDLASPANFSAIAISLLNGAGGFASSYYYMVASFPKTVVVEDFNRDGKADLGVAHQYSNLITILLGDGAGNFSTLTPFTAPGSSGLMIGGDFNADNRPDLAVLIGGFVSTTRDVAIYTGDGAGGFSGPVYLAAGGVPSSITAADLNADGRLDLAVANSFLGTVSVLLNDGSGNFSAAPYSPLRAAAKTDYVFAEDLNKDGRPELITANSEPNTISIMLNNGAGFDAPATLDAKNYPVGVRAADFNADGNLDLAVVASNAAGNILIFTGDGAGNFAGPSFFTAGGGARDIAVGDYNRDGKPDLAVAGTPTTSPNTTILLNTFEAQPCLSVSDATVTEGDSGTTGMAFTVSLSAPSAETVKVNYFLKDETAKKGADYLHASGRLEFAPGVTTQTVRVSVVNNALDDFDKKFRFILSNPAHAALGDAQATGTILDNDPEPVISINDVSGKEGTSFGDSSSLLFTATLSAPSAKPVSVNYAFSGGTATPNTDYYPAPFPTSLIFPAGTTTLKFGVTIAHDDDYEPDETFFLALTNPANATVARARIQATIVNDDAPPFIAIDNSRIFAPEGNSGTRGFPVVVQLSAASYQTITVNYSTVDGSAVAGSDYASTSGTLTFNPGETQKTFDVPIVGDTIDEADETLTISLGGATNATIDTAPPLVVIRDDDGPNISVNDVRVVEGDTGTRNATFTLTLSAISPQPVSVNFNTSDGTATAGTDYARASGRLVSVPAGQISATFNVQIAGDLNIEPDETFNVNLSNASNGTITDVQGVCTILNDDAATGTLQFSAPSYGADENTNATVSITRVGDKTGTATVKYQTVDDPAAVPCDPALKRPDGTAYPQGTAYARCDYATTIDTLTFLPGEESKHLVVPLIDDAYAEGAESVQLRLFDASGAVLSATNASAALLIRDNDAAAGQENPSRAHAFFVRMHYLDFLSREPEANEPWSAVLNRCPNAFNLDPSDRSAGCDRMIVSQSFFGSPEFRLKGFYTYTFYRVALERRPTYEEIIPDMRSVTGQNASEVYQKRAQFAADFARRAEFKSAYDALGDTAFVGALLDRYNLQQITTPDPQQPEAGIKATLTRAELINRLGATAGAAQALTRGQVLRAVVESDEVGAIEYKGAFVAMQYYGYLRRTPEESGYQAWLRVITEDPNNIRIMVNGFVNSTEYRLRFGQP